MHDSKDRQFVHALARRLQAPRRPGPGDHRLPADLAKRGALLTPTTSSTSTAAAPT